MFGFFLTLTMNNESVKVKSADVLSVQVAFGWPPVFLSTIKALQEGVNTFSFTQLSPPPCGPNHALMLTPSIVHATVWGRGDSRLHCGENVFFPISGPLVSNCGGDFSLCLVWQPKLRLPQLDGNFHIRIQSIAPPSDTTAVQHCDL